MLDDDPLDLDFGAVDELSSSEGDKRLLFASRATPILESYGYTVELNCTILVRNRNIF